MRWGGSGVSAIRACTVHSPPISSLPSFHGTNGTTPSLRTLLNDLAFPDKKPSLRSFLGREAWCSRLSRRRFYIFSQVFARTSSVRRRVILAASLRLGGIAVSGEMGMEGLFVGAWWVAGFEVNTARTMWWALGNR